MIISNQSVFAASDWLDPAPSDSSPPVVSKQIEGGGKRIGRFD